LIGLIKEDEMNVLKKEEQNKVTIKPYSFPQLIPWAEILLPKEDSCKIASEEVLIHSVIEDREVAKEVNLAPILPNFVWRLYVIRKYRLIAHSR